MTQRRYLLAESEIPTHWYNVVADLPAPPPPSAAPGHRGSRSGRTILTPLFPMALIGQEVSPERWHPIPDIVREVYSLWRPTPLYRALGLEQALDTDCKIFYKYEGVSPAGSHKPNTAVPQAYYNQQEGVKRIATETGRGPVGLVAGVRRGLFGIEVKVYMVRVSYDTKPYRRAMMETWGSTVVGSPVARHQRRPQGRSRTTPTRPALSASPSPRPSRTPPRATTRSTRSARS